MDDWLDDDWLRQQAAKARAAGPEAFDRFRSDAARQRVLARQARAMGEEGKVTRPIEVGGDALSASIRMRTVPTDPATAVSVGKKQLEPEETANLERELAKAGARTPARGVTNEPPFGTDFRAAIAEFGPDSVTETIRDGKRALVLKGTDHLLALRRESPSFADAWRDYRAPRDLSQTTTGNILFDQLLDAGVRGGATLNLHALARQRGDKERIAKAGNPFADALRAMAGIKGNTLDDGGLIAAREFGGGDVFRYAVAQTPPEEQARMRGWDLVLGVKDPDAPPNKFLDGRDPPTKEELEGWFGADSPILNSFDFAETFNKPVSEFTDKDYESLGLVYSIVADPINFIPGAVIGKAIAAPFKATKWAATKGLGAVAPDAVEWMAKNVAPMSEARLARAVEKGDEAFGGLAKGEAQAAGDEILNVAMAGSRGQAMAEQDRMLRHVKDVMRETPRAAAVDAFKIIENAGEARPVGAIVDDLRKADPAGFSPATVDAVRLAREIPDDMLAALRMRADEVAELERVVVDDVARRSKAAAAIDNEVAAFNRKAGEYKAKGWAKAERNALEQAAEIGKRARPATVAPRAISATAKLEKYVEAMRHPAVMQLEQRMAGATMDLGIDFVDVAKMADFARAAGMSEEAVAAARKLAQANASIGEMMKSLDMLPRHHRLGRFVPRVLKGAASYNPLAHRRAVPQQNVADLRVLVDDLLSGGLEEAAAFGEKEMKALRKWLDGSPAANVRDAGKMRKLVNEKLSDFAKTRAAEGDELYGIAAKLDADALPDTLENAQKVLSARNPGAAFEADPIAAMGKYIEVVYPQIARARIGKRLRDITVKLKSGARTPIALSVPDILLREARAGRKELARFLRRRADGEIVLRTNGVNSAITGYSGGRAVFHNDVRAALNGYEAGSKWVRVSGDAAAKMPALSGRYVPEAIHREIELLAMAQSTENFGALLKVLAKGSSYIVPMMLNTPGFHIRNWLYGVFQGALYGGIGLYGPVGARYAVAAHAAAAFAEHGVRNTGTIRLGKLGEKGIVTVPQMAELLLKGGLVETGRVAEAAAFAKGTMRYADEPLKGLGQGLLPYSRGGMITDEHLFRRAVNRPIARAQGLGGAMSKGSATIENVQKAHLYLYLRGEKGMTHAEALARTTRAFFDYTGTRLSGLEKQLRALFPFWQWVRYSSEQLVDVAMNNPRMFSQINRMFRSFGTEQVSGVPQSTETAMSSFARERGAELVPKGVATRIDQAKAALGLEDTRKNLYAWAPERPGSSLPNLAHPLEWMAEQLGPMTKVPAELMTGRHMLGDMPLDPGYLEGVTPGFGGLRYKMMPQYALRNIGLPWAADAATAALPTASRYSDVEQQQKLLYTLLSRIAGQRIYPFDPMGNIVKRQGKGRHLQVEAEKLQGQRADETAQDVSPLWSLLLRVMQDTQEAP